jgi:hypothetical protein
MVKSSLFQDVTMLLFTLWSVVVLATLFVAGYSHYRYRIINNRYYEYMLSEASRENGAHQVGAGPLPYTNGKRLLPLLTLLMMCALVPLSMLV